MFVFESANVFWMVSSFIMLSSVIFIISTSYSAKESTITKFQWAVLMTHLLLNIALLVLSIIESNRVSDMNNDLANKIKGRTMWGIVSSSIFIALSFIPIFIYLITRQKIVKTEMESVFSKENPPFTIEEK